MTTLTVSHHGLCSLVLRQLEEGSVTLQYEPIFDLKLQAGSNENL